MSGPDYWNVFAADLKNEPHGSARGPYPNSDRTLPGLAGLSLAHRSRLFVCRAAPSTCRSRSVLGTAAARGQLRSLRAR
eukprot:6001606-Prymnesium_polylepis.2